MRTYISLNALFFILIAPLLHALRYTLPSLLSPYYTASKPFTSVLHTFTLYLHTLKHRDLLSLFLRVRDWSTNSKDSDTGNNDINGENSHGNSSLPNSGTESSIGISGSGSGGSRNSCSGQDALLSFKLALM